MIYKHRYYTNNPNSTTFAAPGEDSLTLTMKKWIVATASQ